MKLFCKPGGQACSYILAISILLVAVTAISVYINLEKAREQYKQLAIVMGHSFLKAIIATREWNAEHGGVYVPITEKIQPNPFLKDPLKNIETKDGMKLTKVNPAYMSRLVAELLHRENGIEIHIASSNPLRPENRADGWEQQALRRFERGSREESAVIGEGEAAVFRFMEPLRTERECLRCHGEQGHSLGDIRGGISISFPYTPFVKTMRITNRQIYAVHAFFLAACLGITFVLGRKLIRNVRELEASLSHIRTLEGLLPICSRCKKIRNEDTDEWDQSSWVTVESFIQDKTDARFTHGLCPECLKTLYPEYVDDFRRLRTERARSGEQHTAERS